MAIETASGTARDKEDKSYVKSPIRPNQTAQEVVVGNNVSVQNGLLSGVEFDAIEFFYPDQKTEQFKYYTGGIGGTLVATITVIYTDKTKRYLSSAARS